MFKAIELTYSAAFTLYLCITLTVVIGIWIFSHYRARKKVPVITHYQLCICDYCHFNYLEESSKKLNRCPECGLYNKENSFRKVKYTQTH